jgi:hypothetical protein
MEEGRGVVRERQKDKMVECVFIFVVHYQDDQFHLIR